MGITKQYLRYVAGNVFNLIGSSQSHVVFVKFRQQSGRFIAVGGCEQVLIWDIRTGEKVLTLVPDTTSNPEVTVICSCPDNRHLAVGYRDGTVRVFNMQTGTCVITFNGHTSAITCLNYDHKGARIVSGSKDTEIVVWDVVNENGLFRLKGHKGPVTQCYFLRTSNILVSSSKDTFLKFWDLDIQHCFKTVVGHRSEIWDFAPLPEGGRIITGTSDSELRVWDLRFRDGCGEGHSVAKKTKPAGDEEEKTELEDDSSILSCTKFGSVLREGRDHVTTVKVDEDRAILACHGNSRLVELFRFATDEEVKKRVAKRLKKLKKEQKLQQSGASGISFLPLQTLQDEIRKVGTIKPPSKVKSLDMCMEPGGNAIKLVLLLANNSLHLYEVDLREAKSTTVKEKSQLVLPAHRTDVRTLCFSSDNTSVLSASAESVKIWNRSTQQCIRTLESEYALSSIFVPGDRHCVIGTKSGKLQLFDIAGATLLENVSAHTGAVWSLCSFPDQKGFASGSADKEVKFWEYEFVTDASDEESSSKASKRRRLTLIHTRTLQMSEDVLCIRFSQNGRLLAVSLLDNTVKVFFVDTLKFFLSLYGHKFPVLCMDITDDSSLIATGSADRNVKIWGLDFGDCHRSIFAHDNSIMCLQFVPKTHLLFTGGKDGLVKQWDADNFEKIATLKGHHGEVWAITVSPNGQHIVSASHDKSIRIWDKTDEIIVLDEVKEIEREEMFEEGLTSKDEAVIPGETATEVGMATKRSIETLKAAEKLMESLDIHREECEKLAEYASECKAAKRELPRPTPHPLMVAYKAHTADHLVLHILKQIKSSELEEALLVLPFSYVIQLLKEIDVFLDKRWSVELSCRCLFFLLSIHHGQITANEVLLPVIDKLRTVALQRVREIRDCVGFNLAGMQFLQRQIENQQEVKMFVDATQRFSEKRKKRKKKERLAQRALLTL